MAEFTAFLIGIIFLIGMTVNSTTFQFDANKTNKVLTEVCSKNSGIETSKIGIDDFRFKCKDGAEFKVKRQ